MTYEISQHGFHRTLSHCFANELVECFIIVKSLMAGWEKKSKCLIYLPTDDRKECTQLIQFQSWALLLEHISRWVAFPRHAGSWKVRTVFPIACWRLLQSGTPDYWPLELKPDHEEPWKWPNPVRKVWLHIKEDLGRKVTGSKKSVPARNFCCGMNTSCGDLYT